MPKFKEITFTDGECEVMVHISPKNPNKIYRAYCYTRDIPDMPENWKFKLCERNSCFSDITSPKNKIIDKLYSNDFICTELEEME
jgi:hypothetical protein